MIQGLLNLGHRHCGFGTCQSIGFLQLHASSAEVDVSYDHNTRLQYLVCAVTSATVLSFAQLRASLRGLDVSRDHNMQVKYLLMHYCPFLFHAARLCRKRPGAQEFMRIPCKKKGITSVTTSCWEGERETEFLHLREYSKEKFQVFTTCGSAAKRAVLLETFPQLDAAKIGDSRSTSFEQLVMQAVRHTRPPFLLTLLPFSSCLPIPCWPHSLLLTHTLRPRDH